MIERGDAIRRPVDSTLSTREVHRGMAGIPVPQTEVLARIRQNAPVLAIVVEQTALGNTNKPLFDLLLKIDGQWLQARSEQGFTPGTVLMVEPGAGNSLVALTRPDAAQLERMIQASLSFWQAHTLPKVHPTQLPPLPAPGSLNQLVQSTPNLAPLINWLSQSSTLSSRNIAQWVQAFQPLGQPSTAPIPLTANPLPAATLPPLPTGNLPVPPALPFIASVQTPLPAPIQPLGPMAQAITAAAERQGPGAAGLAPATPALPPGNPLAQGLGANSQSGITAQPATVSMAQRLNPASALQTLITTANPLPAATVPANPRATNPTTVNPSAVTPANLVNALATGPAGSAPLTTDQAVAPQWQNLPALKAGKSAIPIEIRLGQWLALIDQNIRHHPASLQQSLAIKAQQILNQAQTSYSPAMQSPVISGSQTTSQEQLQPLLQLRQWLEGVQAKVQNNAIQQSLGTMTQADLPPVQQISIPLIWLGMSAWANLEWWHERRERKDEEKERKADRPWRFRLFLELKPLAPLCADLTWHNNQAQVIFWSQDPGTLNLLNEHMDTLTAWTEGLGERDFCTRHGMPPKKSTPKADDFQPLVDIRT